MRTRLAHLWNMLTSTYWFAPTVMVLASSGMAFGTLWIDRMVAGRFEDSTLIFSGGPDGARGMLTAVAGSVITVASLVFSITIATLTQASQQFGPRLLRNFMRSRPNQLVLGVFVATFVYSVLVLRTIRADNDVPNISITVAIALALASLGVLIYFIHHTARGLQAPIVIANVAHELHGRIDQLYPKDVGHSAADEQDAADFSDRLRREGAVVRASDNGYLQVINAELLLEALTEKQMRVELLRRPGHFIARGQPIAWAAPLDKCDDLACDAVNRAMILGSERTEEQDVEFAVNQLVEIAVRALSPGVNDPFTAITCLDHLGSAAARVAGRTFPSRLRADKDEEPRLSVDATDFAGICDAMFNLIRQNCAGSVAVSIHFLDTIAHVIASTPDMPVPRRRHLIRHAEMMFNDAISNPALPPHDRKAIEARFEPFAALEGFDSQTKIER